MKNKVLITFLFSTILTAFSFAVNTQNKLIGKNVSIFYPENYNAKAQQPSFALLKEPVSEGDIPGNWDFYPHFYSSEKLSIAAFPIKNGTSLYGTGETTGPLLRNGQKIELWNTDNYKYSLAGGKRLYQSHPWVLGVNKDGSAFGIIADNTWRQQIDLSDSIRFISEGPAFRVIVIKRNSPQEVVEELSNLIGKIEMPPLWSLGYQQSKYSYVPDTRIKSVADTFRLKNLPCDVIWMDIDYMDHFKIFTFDKNKIPNPNAVNDYLHNKGFHSIWMIDPGVKVEKDYSVYESGTKGNHWVLTDSLKEFHGKVWPGECAFPDFTRPETREWWSNLYKNYMATGIDGVWNDMNEPSVFDGPDGTMPTNNWHRGGGDLPADIHLRYHNVYGMLMVKASREGILKASPTKRPFILSRSGYLGSNRYAATWTGDNCGRESHMKLSIPMTLNMGLSGQPFCGPDLGGFAENTSADLFGQWIAMGIFFPFTRGHASNDVNNKEPWAFGPEIENVSRTALNRRYKLLPYYYTLFHEAATIGLPVMRPVFFADAKDSTLRKEQQIFLIGNDLLVIPRWAVNPNIPKGTWRDFPFGNEQKDNYQADIRIKEGSIVPMGKIIQNTTEYNTDSLTLVVSLDKKGQANGTLYEDAGDGFGYKNGEYCLSNFSARKHGKKVQIEIKHAEGNDKSACKYFNVIILTNNGPVNYGWTNKNKFTITGIKE